jgi:hypothetical protein
MLKKLQYIVAALLLPMMIGGASLALVAPSQPAWADAADAACEGLNEAGLAETDPEGGCSESNAGTTVTGVIGTVVNILSFLVGVVAVIMVIVGGFRYVTSGGDANATKSARNTIIYALVGVAIALLAQVLVRYVFTALT